MLRTLFNIPRDQKFIVACSGGADSMAVADFYRRGNKNFSVAYFHHGTPQADEMLRVVSSWSEKHRVPLLAGRLAASKPKDESPEEFWRNERYTWLLRFGLPVVTAHHLDDAVEGYVFSCLHGLGKILPSRNGLILRPFLLNRKSQLVDWCVRYDVPYVEDASNQDVRFPRNRIRHELLPIALKVNPGLHKVIKKKILEQDAVRKDDRDRCSTELSVAVNN